MARVLVTGGAGYLGSILVEYLLAKDHQVTVVDNFMYKQTSLLRFCSHVKFDVVNCDCRDFDKYKDAIDFSDFVFPLAAITGAPACDKDPDRSKKINFDAVWDLCRRLSRRQVVIYPNTNSGYGIMEEGTSECTEESPLNPVSYYGKHKCRAEQAVMEGENSVTFRLATVFGVSSRMRLDLLVNDLVYRAVTDRAIALFEGDFKRNYISIHDVARAFVFAMNRIDHLRGQVYNLGLDSANLSKRELCGKIKEQVPELEIFESKLGKDPDKRNYIVSNKKLENAGFKASVKIESGIFELLQAFRMIRRTEFSNL